MAIKATRSEIWSAIVDDRAGGAADRLEQLAAAKVNLEMVFARRTPEHPGSGVLFVGPIKGAKGEKAASRAGFSKPQNIHGIRIEGGDKPGLGAKITRALGDAGVSFRGLTAIAVGSKFVSYVACDNADDAAKAVAVLKKL